MGFDRVDAGSDPGFDSLVRLRQCLRNLERLRDPILRHDDHAVVVRHHQVDFASGALVFPGGKVDPQDHDPALADFCDGGASDPAMRAIQIAAIREAYEECGVLLARTGGQADLIAGAELATLEDARARLNRGDTTFLAILREHGLRLACDQLVRFAHWVPPDGTDLLFANAVFQWVPGHLKQLQRLLGRLRSELDYAKIEEIMERGLHQYVDALQVQLNEVGGAVQKQFFEL